MTKITTVAGAAVAVSVMLAGCTPTTEHAYTGSTVAAPTIWTGSPAPAGTDGHGPRGGSATDAPTEGSNLHQYIVDNKIAETPFKKDQPGTPKIEFPLPPGWSPAGDMTPDWAYGAIYYGTEMKALEDSTYMYAIGSKLAGNVDADKILELAPGQLNALPEFNPRNAPERAKFAGYDAVNYVGTYTWEGKERAVGQETIVIPGKDALFVLQLNGEAPAGQEQAVIDAVKTIREQTKITAPA